MTQADLSLFIPEIFLSLFALSALMVGVFFNSERNTALIYNATIVVLLLIGLTSFLEVGNREMFNGLLIDDQFANYLKFVIMFSGAAVLATSVRYLKRTGLYVMEFPVLIVLAIIGMNIMVMANNLLSLYIGLELQSLSLYILAAMRRDHLRSAEAGLKYFVLGAMSSGLFLFGASFIYGFTGAIDFSSVAQAVADAPNLGTIVGLALILAAIAFKISAAPFHMWTPDVYQGSPTATTSFFATAPKLAAAGMLARIAYSGFSDAVLAWQQILAALALISVFVGAIGGIAQTNIKRLMAYSSILNMGFVLMALAAGTPEGLASMLIYMTIYCVASIGMFAVIMSMERDNREVVEISEFGLLSQKAPLVALGMGVLLFSTAGIPPLAGFIGKYVSIMAAVNAKLTWLAVAAVIASVIAAFYYLRLVFLMYFGEEPTRDHDRKWTLSQGFVFAVSVFLIVIWMFNLFGLDSAAQQAAQSLAG